MGRLEVQGIVSVKDDMPRVQFRQLDDKGNVIVSWESEVVDAREMAQQIVEAAMNAVYDAAIVSFFKSRDPEDYREMSAQMLVLIRQHRADIWGLPDQPEDWREKAG